MGISTLLTNDVSIFFINVKTNFHKSSKNSIKKSNWLCYFRVLSFWQFDISQKKKKKKKKVPRKAWKKREICLLVDSNLCWKLVLLVPIILNDKLSGTSFALFVDDFSFLSCKFDSFKLILLYWIILFIYIISKQYKLLLPFLLWSSEYFFHSLKNEKKIYISSFI